MSVQTEATPQEQPETRHPAETTPENPVTPPESAQPNAAPATTFTPVYVGGRKFESHEELIAYTSELEQQKIAFESARATAPVATPADVDPDKEIADMMFQDPVTAIKIIRNQTKQEIKKEQDIDNAKARAWAQFYTEFPDLKGHEDFVEATNAKHASRFSKLPLEQAIKELGTSVRGRLASIRNAPTGGATLPSAQVVTTGASSGPGTQVPTQAKTLTFVEQMQKLRSRGKN